MTEWRKKPRIGKSEFMPLLPEILKRLEMGETYKQMHDDLTANNRLKIGYDQFARYIRKHLQNQPAKRTSQIAPSVPKEKPVNKAHPFFMGDQKPGDGERRRNADSELHSSVPNRERIYGTATNKE